MKNRTYGAVYLLRKTGMTLTEIRELDLKQFGEIYSEVAFQESVEEYQKAKYLAHILAAIANTIPRKSSRSYRADDFLLSEEPRRPGSSPGGDKEELKALAERFGIKLPTREIQEL